MAANVKPAAISKVLADNRLDNHRPSNTPIRLVQIKATAAPVNTNQGEWDSAVINKVATWVLSPISAKKMVIKVVPKTFHQDTPGDGCSA